MTSKYYVFQYLLLLPMCCARKDQLLDFRWSYYLALRDDPEIRMNVTEIITSKGYPCEEYDVHTRDGFILGIQRIPHGRIGTREQSRPVVLLQHGLLGSSADWVENTVNESLGFYLADAGFDVWLGNVRGNTYGLRHATLKPDQEQFWDFSWDEIAAYDLPATVQLILNVTHDTNLVYIGFSQGSQCAFAQLSRDQSLTKKIRLFVALAPVAYLGHIRSPLRYLAPFGQNLQFLFTIFGTKDFLPSNWVFRWLARNVCGHEIPDILCENILFLFGGYDYKYMNMSRIPVYVAHSPAGTSVRNIIHYAQSIQSGAFQMFNFGAEENKKRYNQTTPPQYFPSNIQVPVALFSASGDWLAVPTDIQMLISELQNVVLHKQISEWEHLDFTWAINAPTACYNDVIDLIKRFYNIA